MPISRSAFEASKAEEDTFVDGKTFQAYSITPSNAILQAGKVI